MIDTPLFNARELIWAAANDALDLASLDDNSVLMLAEVACTLLTRRFQKSAEVTSPDLAKKLVKTWIAGEKNEVFGVVYLDNQNRVIDKVIHFYGTINGAAVYPRIIVEKALALGGCAHVILTHCHPSGIAEPSNADIRITKTIKNALALIDISVLDHLIVGEDVVSLAERGEL